MNSFVYSSVSYRGTYTSDSIAVLEVYRAMTVWDCWKAGIAGKLGLLEYVLIQ